MAGPIRTHSGATIVASLRNDGREGHVHANPSLRLLFQLEAKDAFSEVNLDSTLTVNGTLRVLQQLHRNGVQQGLQCKHKDGTYDGPRDDTAQQRPCKHAQRRQQTTFHFLPVVNVRMSTCRIPQHGEHTPTTKPHRVTVGIKPIKCKERSAPSEHVFVHNWPLRKHSAQMLAKMAYGE